MNRANLARYSKVIHSAMQGREYDFPHFNRLIIQYGIVQPGIHLFEDIAYIYHTILHRRLVHDHDLVLIQ
jgi:hypothetical protein